MKEVEFKGVQYRIRMLDCFKQFHVARRLAPLIAGLAKASEQVPSSVKEAATENAGQWFNLISGSIAEGFASLSDETADYIIQTCLAVVDRDAGKGTWAPLTRNQKLMYQDIDMATMVGLTIAVIQENLAGFFSSAQPDSQEAKSAGA